MSKLEHYQDPKTAGMGRLAISIKLSKNVGKQLKDGIIDELQNDSRVDEISRWCENKIDMPPWLAEMIETVDEPDSKVSEAPRQPF